jgi:pimeloyl-ACP methyl ester carboxylesterase
MLNLSTLNMQGPDDRSEDESSGPYDIESAFGQRFIPRLNLDEHENGPAPDGNMYANTYAKLSHGITAYYIVDPPEPNDDLSEVSSISRDIPVILCLHGLTNSSYMYRDLAEQLSVNTSSQVIAFDFYGRGRSPWTGAKCSLDTFVNQATELLDRKCNLLLFLLHYCCLL